MKKNHYKLTIFLSIIVVLLVSIFTILASRQFFGTNGIAGLEPKIKTFGHSSSLILFGLIFLCIIIPPFPLPIPALEIIAGALFGFLPGFILVWLAQFTSSITVYGLTEYIPKSFLKKILGNKTFSKYKKFVDKKGALAVFLIRVTMVAPFSISYLAGLSKVDFTGFAMSTALGIIPEALIFVYAGTILTKYIGTNIWYLFTIFIIAGTIPITIWLLSKLFSTKTGK